MQKKCSNVQNIRIGWEQSKINTILESVHEYTFPPELPNMGWELGCDGAFLRDLQAYWLEKYDWQAAERELNKYPHHIAEIEDTKIHFVYVEGESAGKRPLLLSHGWPGSFYEFWPVIDMLAFPSRNGGRKEDAFDLIIPSLPGFGLSSRPQKLVGARTAARLFNSLMTQNLGYSRYLAHGGDWGSAVTAWLGLDYPKSLQSIHMDIFPVRPAGKPQNPEEERWIQAQPAKEADLGGYMLLQRSKPQSLVWAAAGNPLGQAAWIAERFHDWADLREKPFEKVFSLDTLLTDIMLYVMYDTFAASAWFYAGCTKENALIPEGSRCEVPTGFSSWPDPRVVPVPRSRVELGYNLQFWREEPKGGHFASLEEPIAFVRGLRDWANSVQA